MKTTNLKVKSMVFTFVVLSGFVVTSSCAKDRMKSQFVSDLRYSDTDAEDSFESELVTEIPTLIEYQIPRTKKIPKASTPPQEREEEKEEVVETKPTKSTETSTTTSSDTIGMDFTQTSSGNDNLDWVQTSTKAVNFSTFQSLAWDKDAVRRQWSNLIYSVVLREEPIYLNKTPKDISLFCPRYSELQVGEKLNFWGQLFVAIAERESSWKPTTYFIENTMGSDSVTKTQIASEGLLQLSYQDEKNHRLDCGFDWQKDKNLHYKDEKKTIFNPFLNLRCGIKILAKQLRKHNKIVIGKGAYWSVIKEDNKSNKIGLISKRTKSLSFCH